MEAFGRELQRMREGRGISRRTLGELCGMSGKSIARYERGESMPSLEDALRLAEFFGVPLERMCGRF